MKSRWGRKPLTQRVADILGHAVRAEFTTRPGQLNVIFMLGGVLLVLTAAVTQLVALVVHIFDPHAAAGASFFGLFVAWALVSLMCIGLVTIVDDLGHGGTATQGPSGPTKVE